MLGVFHVKVRGRLVGENQFGTVDDGARKARNLTLPVGQFLRRVIREIRNMAVRKGFRGAAFGLFLAFAGGERREHDVFKHRPVF